MKTLVYYVDRFIKFINIKDEMNDEEKLRFYIEGHKQLTLLERIKLIREDCDYIPDYNKRVFSDVQIFYNEFTPIPFGTITTCERPMDFNGDLKAWMKIIHIDHRKELKLSREKEENYKALMENRYRNYNRMIDKFLKID